MGIIDKAVIMIGCDNDKLPVLEVLLGNCQQEFLDYTKRADIPLAAESVILQMVIYNYNRLGAEGLASNSYSGISESYLETYPTNIINQLNKYRKLIAI